MFRLLLNSFLFMLLANYSYADPRFGVVKSYSQQSDWKKQEHQVHLEFVLDGEENIAYSILIPLSAQEMIDFNIGEEKLLTIVNEQPDLLVGRSLFTLEFGESSDSYQGKGSSIDLKSEAWGVDENSFMVTEVALPLVILNGKESIPVNSITGDLLGKIFSRDAVESFISDKPGSSNYIYYAQDQESWFVVEASSKDSHWTPSLEQMGSVRTVKGNDRYRTGMTGPVFRVVLSDGKTIRFASQDSDFRVGNRWIDVGSGWVDLDDAAYIEGSWGPWGAFGKAIHPIVRTWE